MMKKWAKNLKMRWNWLNLADLLKYNGLWALAPNAIEPSDLYHAELVGICFENCQKMAPVQEWLVKLQERFL
jgi:hypothetical protein